MERIGNVITIEGGLKKRESVMCEGDWSHAAVFACMGALGGEITMTGLNQDSLQGDKAILSYLKEIGVNVTVEKDFVSISKNKLIAADFNIDETPDLAPVLCAVLGLCKGRSTVCGISRLRIKESDRAQAICSMLKALGAGVELTEDKLIIDGVESYKGGSISTFNDHRIAMMAAVASCGCDGIIEIDDGSCVNKSAPLFWSEFAALGGKTEE